MVISTDCLSTLEPRDYASGLAEVIKYGIIYDADFFAWLEANQAKLNARDSKALSYAIQCSCQIKADIVAQDERRTFQQDVFLLMYRYTHVLMLCF